MAPANRRDHRAFLSDHPRRGGGVRPKPSSLRSAHARAIPELGRPAPLAVGGPRPVRVTRSAVCIEVEASGLWTELYSHLQEEEKEAGKADSAWAPIQVHRRSDTPYFLIWEQNGEFRFGLGF